MRTQTYEGSQLMKRSLIAAAVIAAFALTNMPAQAASESANYVAAVGLAQGLPGSQQTGQRVGVGGWAFPGRATAPTSIKIVDSNPLGSASIAVVVCAGGCDTFQMGFCTNGGGIASLANKGIPANQSLRIAVHANEPGGIWTNVGPCDGVATAGTLTLTW